MKKRPFGTKNASSSSMAILAALAVAAGVAAFLRRPIKPPAAEGTWQPAESQRTRR